MGGVAGGLKLMVRYIYFKFPMDSEVRPDWFMYGNEVPDYELSAKTAGHELKGAINILNACITIQKKTNTRGITTTMLLMIDYFGLRLVGMPYLNLEKNCLWER